MPGPTTTLRAAAPGRNVMGSDLSITDPKQRVLEFLGFSGEGYAGFDRELIQNLKLKEAAEGTVTYELTIPEGFSNRMGNLHGGAAALVFDVTTTTALVPGARKGFWQYAGVTRNLNITYIRPASIGATVTVKCTVVHAGKKLTTIKGEMFDKDGKILCMAEHLKASIDPPASKI